MTDTCDPTGGQPDCEAIGDDMATCETGEVRSVELYVAVLGASNYTYAEATWSQRLGDFVMSTTRPFVKLEGCRRSAFEALDLPAMRPLPPCERFLFCFTSSFPRLAWRKRNSG